MGGEKGTHFSGIMWVACSYGPEMLAWSLQGSSPWPPPPNVSLGLTRSQRLCPLEDTVPLMVSEPKKLEKSRSVGPEPTAHFSLRAPCLLSFRYKYFSRLLPTTKPPRFSKVSSFSVNCQS